MAALLEPYDWSEDDYVTLTQAGERATCTHAESARAYHVHIEPRAPGRPAKVTSIETCQACGAELSRNESGGDPHA